MATIEHHEGFTVIDRRTPEPCRVCCCPDDCHSQEYNKPTMECIKYLREEVDWMRKELESQLDDSIEEIRKAVRQVTKERKE